MKQSGESARKGMNTQVAPEPVVALLSTHGVPGRISIRGCFLTHVFNMYSLNFIEVVQTLATRGVVG